MLHTRIAGFLLLLMVIVSAMNSIQNEIVVNELSLVRGNLMFATTKYRQAIREYEQTITMYRVKP